MTSCIFAAIYDYHLLEKVIKDPEEMALWKGKSKHSAYLRNYQFHESLKRLLRSTISYYRIMSEKNS